MTTKAEALNLIAQTLKAQYPGLDAAPELQPSEEQWAQDAEAIYAALSSQGLAIVPREPTDRMLTAAAKAMSPKFRPTQKWMSVKRKHATRYRWMVAAAIGEPMPDETDEAAPP